MNKCRSIPAGLVEYVRVYLGPRGRDYFLGILREYGHLNVVLPGDPPHPVHFRDGMRVRNAMRESQLCDGWTCHDFDNNWSRVVVQAIVPTVDCDFTLDEFLTKVQEMRGHQKRYFKTKNRAYFRNALAAEKVVDRFLEAYERSSRGEKDLF